MKRHKSSGRNFIKILATLLAILALQACLLEKQNYLIISANDLYETAEELAEYRRQDYNVTHIRISEIGGKNPTAELIRNNLIRYSEIQPIDYLLLVGDTQSIPTFYLSLNEEGYYPTATDVPSDFPYSKLKDSECPEDYENSHIPDIKVGRIPLGEKGLKILIKKIKENEPLNLNSPILFGHGDEVAGYGERHSRILQSRFYSPSLILDTEEDYIIPGTNMVLKTRNSQRNFDELIGKLEETDSKVIIFYGHASDRSMYPFNHYSPSSRELPETLENNGGFLLMTGGCENNNYANPSGCIGTAFLEHPRGAIASIGASKFGGHGHGYSFIPGFFNFVGTIPITIGEAKKQGIIHQTNHELDPIGTCICMESADPKKFSKRLALLGDPALKIYRR